MKTLLNTSRFLALFVVSLLVLAFPAVSPAQAKSAPLQAGTGVSVPSAFSQGEQQCIQPPSNINWMALSDAQLALYGLPSHRALESSPAFWSADLAHYRHRACGSSSTKSTYNFQRASNIWGGNEAISSRGTYKAAMVTFRIPLVTQNLGDSVAFWAGVGGDGDVVSSFELVQAGVSITVSKASNGGIFQSNRGFWEYVSSSGPSVAEQDFPNSGPNALPLYPGDIVTVYTSSNLFGDLYDYFQVCSNHGGGNTCGTKTISGNFSDSATGECIGERQINRPNGGQGPLADFGVEPLNGCDVVNNNSGIEAGVGNVPHNFHVITNDGTPSGRLLEDVGPISNGDDFTVIWKASS